MGRRRGEQIQVFVNIGDGLKYGFRTNKATFTGYGSVLGQGEAVGEANVFFGANSPKPAVAMMNFDTGRVSSFCDDSKIKDLRKAGWKIGQGGSIRSIIETAKSKTVCVDMPGGYKYAWNITKSEADTAIKVLGAEVPTSTDKLVWGSDPSPPRATKRDANGSTSTFIAPKASVIEAATLAGWTVSDINVEIT